MPTNGKFQIEHIIPWSRWGDYIQRRYPGLRRSDRLTLRSPDHIANYAWSCYFCNHAKGGEERSPRAQRLFDPRVDHWPDHFMFAQSKDYGVIVGVTRAGDETARALRFHEGGAEGGARGALHGHSARTVSPTLADRAVSPLPLGARRRSHDEHGRSHAAAARRLGMPALRSGVGAGQAGRVGTTPCFVQHNAVRCSNKQWGPSLYSV